MGAENQIATQVVERLWAEYPQSCCSLGHGSPFQLLVATMLSAQCTDKRVNLVTPALFARYPEPTAMAAAPVEDVASIIRSTGFYNTKAKNIVAMAKALLADHQGNVPRDLASLVALPGVGRKTANVVLNTAFGEPTIAVDTHIFRLSNRTGLAPGKNVVEVENNLLKRVPEQYRQHAHHWLILHGRYVCKARKPDCENCIVADVCRYEAKTIS